MTRAAKDQPERSEGALPRPARIGILLLSILALAVFAIGCMLHSAWLRTRIAGTLSARTGLDITIGKLALSPRGKLLMRDVRVAEASAMAIRDQPSSRSFGIGRLRVSPCWKTVFSPAVRLDHVAIVGPSMAITHTRDHSMSADSPRASRHAVPETGTAPDESPPAGSRAPTPREQPGPVGSGMAALSSGNTARQANTSRTQNPGNPPPPLADNDQGAAHVVAAEAKNRAGREQAPATASKRQSSTIQQEPFPSLPEAGPANLTRGTPRGVFIGALNRAIEIDNLSIEDGSFTWQPPQVDHPVLELTGFGMKLRDLASGEPRGEIVLTALEILGCKVAGDTHLHITGHEDGRIRLGSLHGDILRGIPEAEIELGTHKQGTPFATRFSISGIDASQLPAWTAETHGDLLMLAGNIDIVVTARGFLSAPGATQIATRIRGRDLTVEGEQLLANLSAANDNIEGLKSPFTIRSFDMLLKSAAGTSLIDELSVKSDHGIFKGRGFLYNDGQLEMNGRIYVTTEVAHFLDQAKREAPPSKPFGFTPFHRTTWFTPGNDFSIRGSLWSPLTDIWSAGTLNSLPQLIELLAGNAREDLMLPSLPPPSQTSP